MDIDINLWLKRAGINKQLATEICKSMENELNRMGYPTIEYAARNNRTTNIDFGDHARLLNHLVIIDEYELNYSKVDFRKIDDDLALVWNGKLRKKGSYKDGPVTVYAKVVFKMDTRNRKLRVKKLRYHESWSLPALMSLFD